MHATVAPERRHGTAERGAVIALVAFCLFALFAVIALAIDAGMMMRRRQQFQLALDAASLRGAELIEQGESDLSRVSGAVEAIVDVNLLAQGIDPASRASLQISYLESNTRIQIGGTIGQEYFFAPARSVTEPYLTVRSMTAAKVGNGQTQQFEPGQLILMLDSSGSMRENMEGSSAVEYADPHSGAVISGKRKIDGLYYAAEKLLRLADGMPVTIVTFGDGCRVVSPWRIMSDDPAADSGVSPRQQTVIELFDSTRRTDNKTPIACGAQVALEQALQAPTDKPLVVILLTDGRPTDDRLNGGDEAAAALSQQIGAPLCTAQAKFSLAIQLLDYLRTGIGAVVHTIGFSSTGAPVDVEFMTRAASVEGAFKPYHCYSPQQLWPGHGPKTHGLYYRADNPDLLYAALLGAASTTGSQEGTGSRRVHPIAEDGSGTGAGIER